MQGGSTLWQRGIISAPPENLFIKIYLIKLNLIEQIIKYILI